MRNLRLKGLLLSTLSILSLALSAQTFIPGNTYFDSTGFVEYRAGNTPVVISAPHGGSVEPDTIPDRDCNNCVIQKDSWTKPIAEGMYDAFVEQTGCYPHLIINLLHRKKFDANRDVGDAADGNLTVEKTWRGYHSFIDSAKAQIATDYTRGLFLDIHGHAHAVERVELGYLLSGRELRMSDSVLNTSAFIAESSLKTLVGDNIQNLAHSELLRGESSFGTILTNESFPSVPSTQDPFPMDGESYFSGGYNTQRHGSRDNDGWIDAIQIELNSDIRFNDSTRQILTKSLAASAIEYIDQHFNEDFGDRFCAVLTSTNDLEQRRTEFSIFPNPTQRSFRVKSPLENGDIALYNSIGQRILSETWNGQTIDIEQLPAGYYLVQFSNAGQVLGSETLIVVE